MNPLHLSRSSNFSFRGYPDARVNLRSPTFRGQVPRRSPTYPEIDFDGSTDRFPPHQRSWADKQLFFDETISRLHQVLEAYQPQLEETSNGFKSEIAGIKMYANQTITDTLWEMRFNPKKMNRRDTLKMDEAEDNSTASARLAECKKVKQALDRLERVLQAATRGTKAAISPKRPASDNTQDQAAIERTVSKLQTSGSQCLELLTASKKKYSQFVPLLEELGFLKTIVDGWEAFHTEVDVIENGDVDERLQDDEEILKLNRVVVLG